MNIGDSVKESAIEDEDETSSKFRDTSPPTYVCSEHSQNDVSQSRALTSIPKSSATHEPLPDKVALPLDARFFALRTVPWTSLIVEGVTVLLLGA